MSEFYERALKNIHEAKWKNPASKEKALRACRALYMNDRAAMRSLKAALGHKKHTDVVVFDEVANVPKSMWTAPLPASPLTKMKVEPIDLRELLEELRGK